MSNSNDSAPVDPFDCGSRQSLRYQSQHVPDPKETPLPVWLAPILGLIVGALAGLPMAAQNGARFAAVLIILMAAVGCAGGAVILVIDMFRRLLSEPATHDALRKRNSGPHWHRQGSALSTTVPVLLLEENAHEESGRPLEAALAMLLSEAADAGAVLVDLDPRGEPTTHCYARDMRLIDDAAPQMPQEIVAAYRRIFYDDQDLETIGTEVALNADEIIEGGSAPFATRAPLIGVGEPRTRSYWTPATDGVGIQFCRTETARKPVQNA